MTAEGLRKSIKSVLQKKHLGTIQASLGIVSALPLHIPYPQKAILQIFELGTAAKYSEYKVRGSTPYCNITRNGNTGWMRWTVI
jgi:hypothetical protein